MWVLYTGCMSNYKIHSPSKSYPRLVIEKSTTSPVELVGILQVTSAGKKIELGNPQGREFRLMQCLFSPKNFMSAKYEPVVQTHERVFGAIGMSVDARNDRLADHQSADDEMTAIVERSLRNLRRGGAGEHFTFTSQEGRVSMAKVA